MDSLKQQLYQVCLSFLNDRIKTVEQAMTVTQLDAHEETKSSAGDKYETGRAMIHLELEKFAAQLEEFVKSRQTLEKIDAARIMDTVQPGSIVLTDDQHYFIAVSIGQVQADNKTFFCISPVSPIGQMLLGRRQGDVITFRNKKIKILDIAWSAPFQRGLLMPSRDYDIVFLTVH